MFRTKSTRVIASVGAMAGSAILFAMYFANGIVYGSLVGLKGREQDLQNARSRGTTAFAVAIALQVLAMLATASWLPASEHSVRFRAALRLGVAFVLSLVGTVVILVLFFEINRALRLI